MKKVIAGVKLISNSSSNVMILHIDSFSKELKDIIRKNLISICHGKANASRNPEGYSYKKTLKEFLKRLQKKNVKTKIGMIGELISFILLIETQDNHIQVTPFFNMEERSIKKGFDIILYDKSENQLVISEVKSGRPTRNQTPDNKTSNLIHLAKRDIIDRITSENDSPWYGAINGASAIMTHKKAKDAVIDILDDVLNTKPKKRLLKTNKKALLISVLYSNLTDRISLKNADSIYSRILKENKLSPFAILSIQKETYTNIIEFLKAESDG